MLSPSNLTRLRMGYHGDVCDGQGYNIFGRVQKNGEPKTNRNWGTPFSNKPISLSPTHMYKPVSQPKFAQNGMPCVFFLPCELYVKNWALGDSWMTMQMSMPWPNFSCPGTPLANKKTNDYPSCQQWKPLRHKIIFWLQGSMLSLWGISYQTAGWCWRPTGKEGCWTNPWVARGCHRGARGGVHVGAVGAMGAGRHPPLLIGLFKQLRLEHRRRALGQQGMMEAAAIHLGFNGIVETLVEMMWHRGVIPVETWTWGPLLFSSIVRAAHK